MEPAQPINPSMKNTHKGDVREGKQISVFPHTDSPAQLSNKAQLTMTSKTEDTPDEVIFDCKLPFGSTTHLTIDVDLDGKVNIEKAASKRSGAGRQKRTSGFMVQSFDQIARVLNRMDRERNKIPLLRNGLFLSVLAIIPAFLADHFFRTAGAYTIMGLIPLLLAGFLFILGAHALHQAGSNIIKDQTGGITSGHSKSKKHTVFALWLMGVAILLSIWVSQDSLNNPDINPVWQLTRWGIAILIVCVAAWLVQGSDEVQKRPKPNKKWLIFVVAAIVLVAFGLRIWNLSSIPYTLGGDEGEQGVEILRILSGDLTNPFETGWYGVPTFSFFFNAPTVALFGNTMFGLRLIWVFVGTASVYATFLLVKELKGTRLALITSALVATYHYHIHYSRLGSNQISDTLIVALTLLFLMRGYRRGRWLDWALAGVMVGIGQYFYAGGRLALVLAVFLVAYLWIRDRFKMDVINRFGLVVFIIALLVSAWPMFSFGIQYPDKYNARTNQIGILQNQWLENEAILLDQSRAQVLVDQFWRSALAFNAYPDRTAWYGLDGPLLDRLSGALFILGGIAVSFWSLKDRRLAPMVAWWWAAILTGGMLTDTTPSSQRLITTAIPTMFFVAFAINQLREGLVQKISKGLGLNVTVFSIVLISLISLNLYFIEFSPRQIYGGPHAQIGTIIAEKINQDPEPDPEIYFFGSPYMYARIGTLRYLIPDVPKNDILEPLDGPFEPEFPPTKSRLLFIFLPERLDELAWVMATYPEGTINPVQDPNDPQTTIFTMYSVQ